MADTRDTGMRFIYGVFNKRHLSNIGRRLEAIEKLFDNAVSKAVRIGEASNFNDPSKPFFIDDYPALKKRMDELMKSVHDGICSIVETGDREEWLLACDKNDKMVDSLVSSTGISEERLSEWKQRNLEALEAFQSRKISGMGLSSRVWDITEQFYQEMEMALDLGLGEGKSAIKLTKSVRKYLNEPDKLFRRVRDKHGSLRLSKAAKAYHPGRGVYRSSFKNALRLTATENNMAYRKSDSVRWQQLPFVIGIEISLSPNNHPVHDICDELKGRYPKDFVWTGWHPFCRCHATPVLADENEMKKYVGAILNGDKYNMQGKQITEYPESFKNWVKDHAGNIERTQGTGREPYFIKDNAEIIDGILNPKKMLTTLEKAKIRHDARTAEQRQEIIDRWDVRKKNPMHVAANRHAARTPEYVKAIKEQWAARQKKHNLIKKTANNVLTVASDYGEIDFSKLQQYITEGNLTAMQAETKIVAQSISAMKKQETALSALIPDAHNWHKQFSLSELQAVYDAVEKKLNQWASLSLEQQAKKLNFEAIEFLGGNMNNVQSKYKTWEVSQAAYMKKLASVNEEIAIKNIKNELSNIAVWSKEHTKSKKVANLLSNAEAAIANGEDITAIKQKADLAIAEYQKRLAEQARRDAKKGTSAVTFKDEDYSQDRKDAALWSKKKDKDGLYDRKSGDKYFRKFAEKDWKRWTEEEKDVAYLYTSGSSYINEPTYTTYYGIKHGLNNEVRDSWKDINTLTRMIDKSKPFTKDVWLNRGASKGEFLGQFGLDLDDFISNPDSLIGSLGEQKPFMSTAHSKSWGFVDDGADATRSVVYNIYCPKGTKGIYTEPYSAFGNGGRNWDGKTKASLANEVEVILQRGTKLRVIKAEYKNGQWFVDMEVIEQPVKLPNQP